MGGMGTKESTTRGGCASDGCAGGEREMRGRGTTDLLKLPPMRAGGGRREGCGWAGAEARPRATCGNRPKGDPRGDRGGVREKRSRSGLRWW